MQHGELTEKVIGCAIIVHRALGPGFLESVHQNALAHELRKAGLEVECERRIQVAYDGAVVGDFAADMLVQNMLLIENKAGSERLQFKRKTRTEGQLTGLTG